MHILAVEYGMPGYINLYQQISSRAAVYARLSFIADTHALTVVNACRYRNRNLLLIAYLSCSTATLAFFPNDLAGSVTVRTGLNILHSSKEGLLRIYYLACAAALRAWIF